MPFVLINVGVTFKIEMDITFQGLIGKFVLVYSDKVTVFFEETNSNHVNHLKQIFD
jgi:hypothetical protein